MSSYLKRITYIQRNSIGISTCLLSGAIDPLTISGLVKVYTIIPYRFKCQVINALRLRSGHSFETRTH